MSNPPLSSNDLSGAPLGAAASDPSVQQAKATADNVNKMKMHDSAVAAQIAAEKAEAVANAAKLKELSVKLTAKSGSGGRLFGAVTSKEIADGLKAQHGIDIAKSKIVQDEPIKSFGTYELKVKLGYEVTGTLKVVVAEA